MLESEILDLGERPKPMGLDLYKEIERVQSGIPTFDKLIGSIPKANLFVISGYPSSGKTALAVEMYCNWSLMKIPTLMISLEMSKEEILYRCVANRLGVTEDKVTAAFKEDCSLLKIRAQRFFNEVKGYMSIVTDIKKEKIIPYIKSCSEEIIIIDYFGMITKKHELLEETASELKELARETGKIIVALSQRTRTEGNLRGSPALEEICSIITTLEPSSKYESLTVVDVIVQKNRSGPMAAKGANFKVGEVGMGNILMRGDTYKIYGNTDYKLVENEIKEINKAYMPDWKNLDLVKPKSRRTKK